MKTFISALVLSSGLTMVGCLLFNPTETPYLVSAKDHAAQQKVQQHLGQLLLVMPTETGETILAYDIREFMQGGNDAR